MLMKEAYAIYQLLPAHERKLLDETFQLVAAEMDQGGKPHLPHPNDILIWSFELRAPVGAGSRGLHHRDTPGYLQIGNRRQPLRRGSLAAPIGHRTIFLPVAGVMIKAVTRWSRP